MFHKKFGPDRFSRFDVYWIQTNKQTNRQTDRQAKFIYRLSYYAHYVSLSNYHIWSFLRILDEFEDSFVVIQHVVIQSKTGKNYKNFSVTTALYFIRSAYNDVKILQNKMTFK